MTPFYYMTRSAWHTTYQYPLKQMHQCICQSLNLYLLILKVLFMILWGQEELLNGSLIDGASKTLNFDFIDKWWTRLTVCLTKRHSLSPAVQFSVIVVPPFKLWMTILTLLLSIWFAVVLASKVFLPIIFQ